MKNNKNKAVSTENNADDFAMIILANQTVGYCEKGENVNIFLCSDVVLPKEEYRLAFCPEYGLFTNPEKTNNMEA